jgi:shikimate dehydrogenase
MLKYQKLGLVGHPLSHALSPILQNAALHFAGIEGEYLLFDIKPECLVDGIKDMLANGINGFNVTIPHKESLHKMMDDLTKEAGLAGAVNTVKVESGGRLVGHNTDIIGFKLAIKEAFGSLPRKENALVIGSGGSARAVVIALTQLGFKQIIVKGRNQDRVQSFITELEANLIKKATISGTKILSLESSELENFSQLDLVINASPIGLKEDVPPEWLTALTDSLKQHCVCFDLVYAKSGRVPVFTQLALSKGLKVVDGLPMLIHQARYAFQFWTGRMIPPEVMYAAIRAQAMP